MTGHFEKGKWIPDPPVDVFAEFRKAEYKAARAFYQTHVSKIPLTDLVEELVRRCNNRERCGVWESNGEEKREIRVYVGEWKPLFRQSLSTS